MIKVIYDLVYTVLLCLTTVLVGYDYIGISESSALLYLVTVLSASFCVAFGHLKTKGRLLISGITLTVIVAAAFIGKGDFIKDNIRFIWVFVICVVCYAIQFAASCKTGVRAAVATIVLAVAVVFMITKHSVGRGVFVMTMLFEAASVAELIQAGWKKETVIGKKEHVVFIMPFLIVLIIPLCLVKIPDKPYDWRFVRVAYDNIKSGYEVIVQTLFPENGWDGGDNMGFSERAALGGIIKDDPYKVLFVSSDSPNDYRVYLAGKSFDSFDGHRWIKKDDSKTDQRSLDVIETAAAILGHNSDNKKDYMHIVRLHVKYEGIRTSCAFIPAKSSPDTSVDMIQTGGDMRLVKGRKGDYIVDYYRINRDGSDFDDILKNEKELTAKDWELGLQETGDVLKKKLSYNDYKQYREDIYKYYAGDPKLSEKAERFMDDLLDGSDSDLETAKRIEAMLSGYKYTRTPGNIPESVKTGSDFIDYFIFDKREGFCTHFASAFVMLARSRGIPARYVQGYSVLSGSTGFEVDSDRIHAWPEAYFDGVGWIGFEPTPGYRQAAGWEVSDKEGSAGVSHNPYEDYAEKYQNNGSGENDTDEATMKSRVAVNMTLVKRVFLFIALFVLLFGIVDGIIRKLLYQRMDDRQKVLYLCKRNMKTLKRLGLRLKTGETLSEYSERINGKAPAEFTEFIDTYEQALYAPKRQYNADLAVLEKNISEKIKKGVKFIRVGSDILFEKHR